MPASHAGKIAINLMRFILHRKWLHIWKVKKIDEIQDSYREFNTITSKLKRVQDEEDLVIMRNADIIGMTTTGAAKYREIISRLDVKIFYYSQPLYIRKVLMHQFIYFLKSGSSYKRLYSCTKQKPTQLRAALLVYFSAILISLYLFILNLLIHPFFRNVP